MMPDPGPDEIGETAPDEILWDKARTAIAGLESSADTAPRWIAALLGLILALLFLMSGRVLSHINAVRSQEILDRVHHGNAVLEQAGFARAALLQTGLALRDRALSDDSIRAYGEARAALRVRLAELRLLVSPDLRADAASLAASIEAYFTEYDRLSASGRQGLAARLSAPGAAQNGRQFTAQARARLDTIGARELRALDQRRRDTESDQHWMRLMADISVVLAIACGAVSLLLIQSERGRSRLRELHLEFMHTQRLALMGQTSVAIAHEVNQPLTAATNYLAVLARLSTGNTQLPSERTRELVPKIEVQIRRASDIVQRLRNFLAIRDGERVSESPKILIADAVELLGTLDATIKLETHVELGLPSVLVDRVQVQQVLVNLMRNALEAMTDKPQRRLVLKAGTLPGHKVKISIADNGPGLSEHIAKNLFKPFVSSKRSGMGVGLSICQVIVTAHGGRIWADSSPQGTEFHFTLPAAREA
jgi:C4-dicarboxylate-specific signal transduction histidine kinase